MAIGYTELNFVNGGPPPLSAANMNHIDEGVKACADALDSDASTSAKGVVQLASTGVESATKVPKATGAELAAILTAGGFTLTAPSGANSLDGIADTATWKKVAAAVATALNASTIVAGTQWGSGNDGNGGQPPAPKPNNISTSTLGFWGWLEGTSGNSLNSPNIALTTWAFFRVYVKASAPYALENGSYAGMVAGNTEIAPAISGYIPQVLLWRIG